jgi:hypothetical protein
MNVGQLKELLSTWNSNIEITIFTECEIRGHNYLIESTPTMFIKKLPEDYKLVLSWITVSKTKKETP